MGIILGGSGSSGTTLLKTLIDRHPDLYSGPELSVFNKERLYQDWSWNKKYLVPAARNFSTDGWCPYPGNSLLHEDYGWVREDIVQLIEESASIMEFGDAFFDRSLVVNNAKMWIEKTPSNTYGFRSFLASSSMNKVIHMLREPYDTVASLMKRGMSPYFAAGLWVYNNSAGLSVSTSHGGRYCQVKYEKLCLNPEYEMNRICKYIGVDLDGANIFSHSSDKPSSGISTWGNKPSEAISSKSIGGFARLPIELQEDVISALNCFRIKDSVKASKGFRHGSAEAICKEVGYSFIKSVKKKTSARHLERIKDIAVRTLRGYSTGGMHYPGSIVSGS